MEKYFKYPALAYKQEDVDEILNEDNYEDEIDRLVKRTNYPIDPKDMESVLVWCRVPHSELEGCSYESAPTLSPKDEEYEDGEFMSSVIFTKGGGILACHWPISQLEKKLIEAGLVDPSILNQGEVL